MNIKEPIIVIGAPRSGTTLLFSILSSHPSLWSLYRESEGIYGKYFHPEKFSWNRGNVLKRSDVTKEIRESIKSDFFKNAHNYQIIFKNTCSKVYTNFFTEKINRVINEQIISPLLKPNVIRIVEKTPKNCLRIPFINSIFPDALFIYLTREPRSNIGSLIEGWKQVGRYESYRLPKKLQIEGYEGSKWNFFLPPGWEEYSINCRLEEVCAFQYVTANQIAIESLKVIPKERQITIRYEDLILKSQVKIREICNFAGLSYSGGLRLMSENLPPVNTSCSPYFNKWKKNEAKINSVIEKIKNISEEMGYLL